MVRQRSSLIADADRSPKNEAAASLDAVYLSLWRRALEDGAGLELTLTEAAALLGTSTQTLRRRIQRDEIQTRRDSRGRLRVVPLLGLSADLVAEASTDAQATVARLFEELKQVRGELQEAHQQGERLRRELDGAREALSWAQDELAARSYGDLQRWTLGQVPDLDTQRAQRLRVTSKLDEARKLAGRRSWLGVTAIG